ncbi:hypothetical protein [Haloarchaeobius litoreus]|uniref:Uncharacterized protein n=1 Tax=Haloarchaeobius litoreus TaxID=755306 RepID=A0ABD6DH38_9EURY|nr:hypothetical protein [Haloarchaeobius litoreus]
MSERTGFEKAYEAADVSATPRPNVSILTPADYQQKQGISVPDMGPKIVLPDGGTEEMKTGEPVGLGLELTYPDDVEKSVKDKWFVRWAFFHNPTTDGESFQNNVSRYGGPGLQGNLKNVVSVVESHEGSDYRSRSETTQFYMTNRTPGHSKQEWLDKNNPSYDFISHYWHEDDCRKNEQHETFVVIAQVVLYSHRADSPAQIRVGWDVTDVEIRNEQYDQQHDFGTDLDTGKAVREAKIYRRRFGESLKRYYDFAYRADDADQLQKEIAAIKRQNFEQSREDDLISEKRSEFETQLLERKRKIGLWTLISNILRETDSKREETLERLGINPTQWLAGFNKQTYSQEYYETFIEDNPQATVPELLGLKQVGSNRVVYQGLDKTSQNIKDTGLEFITFGRKVYAYRADLEHSALYIIQLMKGADTPDGDPEFLDNAFMFALKKMDYEQQLSFLGTLLDGFTQCESGKRFLGEIFAHRNEPGMFDPRNVFDPPKVTEKEKNEWTRGGPIICVREDRYSEFYDPQTGRLAALDSNATGKQKGNAKAMLENHHKLTKALASGASTYVKMAAEEELRDSVETARGVMQEYHLKFFATNYDSSQLRDLGLDNQAFYDFVTGAQDENPVDSSDFWAAAETSAKWYKVGSKGALHGLTVWKGLDSIPSSLYPLKSGIVVTNMFLVAIGISDATTDNDLEFQEFLSVSVSFSYLVVDSIEHLGKHWKFSFAQQLVKEIGPELMEKLSFWLTVGAALVDVYKSVSRFMLSDIDAAVFGGLIAVLDIGAVWIAGSSAVTGGVAAIVVVAAIGLSFVLGMIRGWVVDPEIAVLIGKTVFGTSEDLDYDDPGQLQFRFVDDDGPNYARQIAILSNQVRGLHTESALYEPKLDSNMKLWHKLHLTFKPGRDLDGELWVRPLFYNSDTGESRYGPLQHKIDLDDSDENRTDQSWDTRCPYLPPDLRSNPTNDELRYYYARAYGDIADAEFVGSSDEIGSINLTSSRIMQGLPTGELERIDSVDVTKHSGEDWQTTVTLTSSILTPLMGIEPLYVTGSPELNPFWNYSLETYLEFIYLPTGVEDKDSVEGLLPDARPSVDADARKLLGTPGVSLELVPLGRKN